MAGVSSPLPSAMSVPRSEERSAAPAGPPGTPTVEQWAGDECGMVTPPLLSRMSSPPASSVRRLTGRELCEYDDEWADLMAPQCTDELDDTEDSTTLFKQRIVAHNRGVGNGHRPSPRFGHTAVVHNDTMVLFGGRDRLCYNDLWTYCFRTTTWTKIEQDERHCPIPRAGHTAVVFDGKMYVFGGVAARGGVHNWWLNDLWQLDLATYAWTHVQKLGCLWPERRKGHTAVVYNSRMYIFGGGQDDTSSPLILFNDLWELDLVTERWTACNYRGDLPPPRMYHVSVLREGGGMVLFGGRADNEAGFFNDVFCIDLNRLHAAELVTYGVSPPAHRMCSTALYHNGTLSIFTGGAFAYLEDSHQLNLDTLRWTPLCKDIDFGGRTRPTTVKWNNTIFTFGGCVTGNGYGVVFFFYFKRICEKERRRREKNTSLANATVVLPSTPATTLTHCTGTSTTTLRFSLSRRPCTAR